MFPTDDKNLHFVKVMPPMTDTDCDPSEYLFLNNLLRLDAFVDTNKIDFF